MASLLFAKSFKTFYEKFLERPKTKVKIMNPQPDCFVSGGLETVLRLSSIFGVAPLHFVKKSDGWRVSISKGKCTYGYCVLALIPLATIIHFVLEFQTDGTRQGYNNMKEIKRFVTRVVEVSILAIISCVMIYLSPDHMRCMVAYLEQLEKINFRLQPSIPPNPSERKKLGLFVFWMMIIVTISFVDGWVGFINNKNVFVMYVYICYWIQQLRKAQFSMVTLLIKNCFENINNKLRTLLNGGIDASGFTCHDTVRRLAVDYTSACDVLRAVDQSHGLIIFLTLCGLLVFLTGSPYFLIANFLMDINSIGMLWYTFNIILELAWCLVHIVSLLSIVEPCHVTQMEMETTRRLICHLLLRRTHTTHEPLAVELELFYRRLMMSKVSYKPLQVVTVSRALVAIIFGCILKYLVIIITL